MSLELNYKAKNIANAEKSTGLKLFAALNAMGEGNIGMTDLAFLLQAGGVSEDEAYAAIDDKGLTGALENVTEALGNAGFLQNAVLSKADMKKIQESKEIIDSHLPTPGKS